MTDSGSYARGGEVPAGVLDVDPGPLPEAVSPCLYRIPIVESRVASAPLLLKGPVTLYVIPEDSDVDHPDTWKPLGVLDGAGLQLAGERKPLDFPDMTLGPWPVDDWSRMLPDWSTPRTLMFDLLPWRPDSRSWRAYRRRTGRTHPAAHRVKSLYRRRRR
ncbi:hypothetical protein [Planomonospora sp. ID82291]|uniref:hypothetical protein n=1 Tax=Planomonospora sp. ID82291 TaxID=2738136 RepID=UPI0018C3C227|nr:hypothetical protein [Planomonospora sp. ID82291]MBG0818948.1 hypothetical protein [Planomonospora sp. ID82291]